MNEIIEQARKEHQRIIDEIERNFFDIPFSNSKFQTEMFVIAAQITPERMYRQLGLSIMDKLRSLKDFEYNLQKELIVQEQHHTKLADPNATDIERRLAKLEIDRFESFDYDRKKMIHDLLVELNVLYTHYKALPKYTRDQFEDGERTHFEQRLRRQVLGLSGAKESLINMVDDSATLASVQEAVAGMDTTQLLNALGDIRERLLAGRIDFQEAKP